MKAIALISGGLDSILAARVIKEQGIEVIPVHFKIPFCHRHKKNTPALDVTSVVRGAIGVEVVSVDIRKEFLQMLINPQHGFGSHMNPCIDCKILMLKTASQLMKDAGASFLVTGEVLGQRPMSQYKQALYTITKKAGLEGFVVRPLSARLLEETTPEKNGWVQREKLLSFNGRGRSAQIELAESFGIHNYNQPAGGCLLTEPEFTKRLSDLITHQELTSHNVELLKIGRHFRISEHAKLVVGRDKEEDDLLMRLASGGEYLFMPSADMAGPTTLGQGIFDEVLIEFSCKITCRYCDLNGKTEARIVYQEISEGQEKSRIVTPSEESELSSVRI